MPWLIWWMEGRGRVDSIKGNKGVQVLVMMFSR